MLVCTAWLSNPALLGPITYVSPARNDVSKAVIAGNYGGAVVNNTVTNSPPRGKLFFRLTQP
jgi:hypothetical protein